MIVDDRFTAWIVFVGADHRRFWRLFTSRGWRHCFMIIPEFNHAQGLADGRTSVVVNVKTNHVAVNVFFMPPEYVAEHMLKEGAKCVIKYKVDRRGLPDYVPRGPLTCVSMLKAVCGIRAWYVWTPQHFARWLIRNGGEMVEEEVQDGPTIRGK